MNNFDSNLILVVLIFIINSILEQSLVLSNPADQFIEDLQAITSNDNETIAAAITIKVYMGTSITTATVVNIPVSQPEIIYKYIDNSKPFVIYVHGYRENPSYENTQTIVEAHLKRGTDNIFVYDWSSLAYDDYVTVFSRITDVSRVFAKTMARLFELGLNIQTTHYVAHSMGAQVAGLAWKYTTYTVPRITGLDPAQPGFYQPGGEHIDRNSAIFVDVIHSDGGFYGALPSTGSVDFFPNGGSRPQPGCDIVGIPLTPTDLCSHWRSWRYYAESVNNIHAFPSIQCDSYINFVLGNCKYNRVIDMGYAAPSDARGMYFLTTNDMSPFGQNYE